MEITRTFLMVKPGAIHRGLAGDVIQRIERKGLNICAIKMLVVSDEQAKMHYLEHKEKSFYKDLIEYIQSGPVIIMAIEGENAVELVRKLAGSTDPLKSEPGTIRGDFSAGIENNIIHTSDALDTAQRELAIYFDESDYVSYHRAIEKWSFNL